MQINIDGKIRKYQDSAITSKNEKSQKASVDIVKANIAKASLSPSRKTISSNYVEYKMTKGQLKFDQTHSFTIQSGKSKEKSIDKAATFSPRTAGMQQNQ